MRVCRFAQKYGDQTGTVVAAAGGNISQCQHLLHQTFGVLRQISRLAEETVEFRLRGMGNEGNQPSSAGQIQFPIAKAARILCSP